MVGVGGYALAAQEMARVQRELRDHIEASRARRDARLARFQGSQVRDYWTAPARVDFDCKYLCAECGFLSDEQRAPCPACKEREWVDLSHEATALALMDKEEHERLRVPLPDPTRQPDEVLTGVPEFTDQELLAPFTGWQCLVYQACVLFDAPHDARPPEWVLHEVRGVDFRVDDRRIPGDRVLLRTPLQPVTDEQLRTSGLDLNRFLRERGLFAAEGEYTLFESRLDTDQPLRVSLRPAPQAILVEQRP